MRSAVRGARDTKLLFFAPCSYPTGMSSAQELRRIALASLKYRAEKKSLLEDGEVLDAYVEDGAGAYNTRPLLSSLEPCLSQETTLHTLNAPVTRPTQPLCAPPIPYKALKLS